MAPWLVFEKFASKVCIEKLHFRALHFSMLSKLLTSVLAWQRGKRLVYRYFCVGSTSFTVFLFCHLLSLRMCDMVRHRSYLEKFLVTVVFLVSFSLCLSCHRLVTEAPGTVRNLDLLSHGFHGLGSSLPADRPNPFSRVTRAVDGTTSLPLEQ